MDVIYKINQKDPERWSKENKMARDLRTQGTTCIEFPEFSYCQLGAGEANNTEMSTGVEQITDVELSSQRMAKSSKTENL